MQISTVQHGEDSEWHLGSCNSLGVVYGNHQTYIQKCCLKPGQQTLTCINKRKSYGWDDGYIEIQGHRYCNDFMSYRIMQRITIKGMNQIIEYALTLSYTNRENFSHTLITFHFYSFSSSTIRTATETVPTTEGI